MSDTEHTERAFSYMRSRFRIERHDDVETTQSKGYWQFKRVCHGECGEGHTAPMRHTLSFTEPGLRDAHGRFMSPYTAWYCWRRAEWAGGCGDAAGGE